MKASQGLVLMAVLNAALLVVVIVQARFLQERSEQQAAAISAPVASRPQVRPASKDVHRPSPSPSPAPLAVASAPLPGERKVVSWRQIESDDYRTYVNNLRAIGCPEETVREVVTADLQKAFAGRRRELLAATVPTNFWQSADGAVLQHEKREFDEAFGDVLKTLLGPEVVPPAGNNEWKLAEMDLRLGFLPSDKRDQTRELLLHYAELDQQIKTLSEGQLPTHDQEQLARLLEDYDLKRKQLSGMLTPEQYEQVDMTVSWTADNLRKAMEKFHPTEDEFRLIFREWRQHDEHLAQLYATGQPDPGNEHVFNNIGKFLPEKRFELYRETWWK